MNISKTVLITGGNKGIGFESARQSGKLGFTILIGSRDQYKGREAATSLLNENINTKSIILDVTDVDTIQSVSQPLASTITYFTL